MLRALAAFLLLLLGAGWAVMVLGMENCTGAKADDLSTGVVTIFFNILGFGLLGNARRAPDEVIAVSLLPMIAAAYYSYFAAVFAIGWLASDMSSCRALSGLPFEDDGREAVHVAIWLGATLSFWVGLVWATIRSARREGRQS